MDVDEYIVNLLAGLVHLRSFDFQIDEEGPIKDVHQFVMKVSDRVPHLEYFSMPPFKHYYKRVGGELVICDRSEFFFVRVNSLHVRLLIFTVMEVVADQWVVR